jgi:hypothetical protein
VCRVEGIVSFVVGSQPQRIGVPPDGLEPFELRSQDFESLWGLRRPGRLGDAQCGGRAGRKAERNAAGEFFHGSLTSVDCCGVERRPVVFGARFDVERRRIDETEIPRCPTVVRQTRLGRADETWIVPLLTAFRDPVESLHTAMAHHIPKKEKFAFERRKIAAGLVAFGGHGFAVRGSGEF